MHQKRHHNKNLNMDSYEKKNACPSPRQHHLFYAMRTTVSTPTENLETTSKNTRFLIHCINFVIHLNYYDFYFSFKNTWMQPAWLLVLLTLLLQRTKLSSAIGTVFNVPEDGFGGLVVSILATGTRVRRFKPGRSRWIFGVSGKSSVCLPSEGK